MSQPSLRIFFFSVDRRMRSLKLLHLWHFSPSSIPYDVPFSSIQALSFSQEADPPSFSVSGPSTLGFFSVFDISRTTRVMREPVPPIFTIVTSTAFLRPFTMTPPFPQDRLPQETFLFSSPQPPPFYPYDFTCFLFKSSLSDVNPLYISISETAGSRNVFYLESTWI